MSMHNEEMIKCESCGAESPFMFHQSVNVSLDPQDKERVLNGSIWAFKCPKCGNETTILYPMLYHDMEKKLMIQLCSVDEVKTWSPFAGLPPGPVGDAMKKNMKGYNLRAVCDTNALREKIRIFDAGLDDLVIEIMKVMVLTGKAGNQVERLLYNGHDDMNLHLAVFVKESEEILRTSLPMEVYNHLKEGVPSKEELFSRGTFFYDVSNFATLFGKDK